MTCRMPIVIMVHHIFVWLTSMYIITLVDILPFYLRLISIGMVHVVCILRGPLSFLFWVPKTGGNSDELFTATAPRCTLESPLWSDEYNVCIARSLYTLSNNS